MKRPLFLIPSIALLLGSIISNLACYNILLTCLFLLSSLICLNLCFFLPSDKNCISAGLTSLMAKNEVIWLVILLIFILAVDIFNIYHLNNYIFYNESQIATKAMLILEDNFKGGFSNFIFIYVTLLFKIFKISPLVLKLAGVLLTFLLLISIYVFFRYVTNNYNTSLFIILTLFCSPGLSLYASEGMNITGSLCCLFFSLYFLTKALKENKDSFIIASGTILGASLLISTHSIINYLVVFIILILENSFNHKALKLTFKETCLLLLPSLAYVLILVSNGKTDESVYNNFTYSCNSIFIWVISNFDTNLDFLSSIFNNSSSFSTLKLNLFSLIYSLVALYGGFIAIKSFNLTINKAITIYLFCGLLYVFFFSTSFEISFLYILPAITCLLTTGLIDLTGFIKSLKYKIILTSLIFSGMILNFLYIDCYLLPFTSTLKDHSESYKISILLDNANIFGNILDNFDIFIDDSLISSPLLLNILNYIPPHRGSRSLNINRQPFTLITNKALNIFIHCKTPCIFIFKNNYSRIFKKVFPASVTYPIHSSDNNVIAYITRINHNDINHTKQFNINHSYTRSSYTLLSGSLFLYSYKKLTFKFLKDDIELTIGNHIIANNSSISELKPYTLLPVTIKGAYPPEILMQSVWVREFEYEPYNLLNTKYKFFQIAPEEIDY